MKSDAKTGARWLIAAMATILMLCLGTVYAWSFFQSLLVKDFKDVFGWSNTQVAWIFSLAILFLGIDRGVGRGAAAQAQPPRDGDDRRGALRRGLRHCRLCLQHQVPAPAVHRVRCRSAASAWASATSTPVATVAKWFPDKKGLATGMVIMGFGLGALFMSKVLAPLFLGITGQEPRDDVPVPERRVPRPRA